MTNATLARHLPPARGLAYHLACFAGLNPAARGFAAAFLHQSALLGWAGLRRRLAFGVLLLSAGAVPWWLLAVPCGWALVGTSAALQLGMREDLGLPVAAVLAVALRRPGHAGTPGRAPPRPRTHDSLPKVSQ